MRVLILCSLLALATAAPSGVVPLAPVAPVVAKLAVLPAATPTIDPGDIQAAAINAQVFAEDQARALAERVVEENNEKVIEADSQVKEKSEEAFWAGQEKQWQALDAAQTAEAKIDGAVANNADALARSAFGGVVIPTYVAAPIFPAPIPAPLAPVAPIAYATPNLIPKEEKEKELVKTAEPEKDSKPEAEKKVEENKETKDNLALPILTPIVAPALKLTQPWIAPIGPVAPVAPIAPVGPFTYVAQPILTPVIKTQW